jgi:gamma-glutamyltranspeptidase/glutathione hydrolase
LKRLGHAVGERELDSGVHAFRRLADGSFEGGADPRREGAWRTGFVEFSAAR